METLKGKVILVTGGAGFLGKNVINELINNGAEESKIIIPRSNEFDLRQEEACARLLSKADLCIHLAANVGGIGYNQAYPYSLFYDNMTMGVNIVEAARIAGVEKLLVVGTICAYPKFTPVPFKEEELWNGYPEETNAPYGLAKKMLLVQLQACRQQHGLNGVFLLPVNLYGPGDEFSDERSHVVPALIKRFYNAKVNNDKEVVVWGTGTATREFLYVEDAGEGVVKALLHYNKPEPVNLGAGFEISIRDLVGKIADIIGYDGEIIWDTSKPDGQPRRCLDTARAELEFSFKAKTSFDEGLKKTIEWYGKNA